MYRGATNPTIAIIGFLLIATSASVGAADENAASPNSSSDVLLAALRQAEDSSTGLVLVPGLLEASSPDRSHQTVSHLEYEPLSLHDPRQLIIDDRQLAPARSRSRSRSSSTWQGYVDALAASRIDENVIIGGQELGTGINAGARARLLYRSDTDDRALNAWDVIAIGINGSDRLSYDSPQLYAPELDDYEASFVSVESNAIHRTEYKRRVRQQFLGIRYVDQSDSIETLLPYFAGPPFRQEAHNRMLGMQVGLDQSWSNRSRFQFGWGVKAGLFYSSADQAGYVYEGTANTYPLLLDYHADLAYRIFEQAYLGIGLIGMRLEDQYQSRFAWQDPESTHPVTILGMRLGFDYAY